MMNQGGECECHHHKFLPLLVILFALVFLLGNTGVFSSQLVGVLWPILVGLAGILKLGESKCRCC